MDDADRAGLLDEWYRLYADRVLAYLLHRTDPETAQDLVQEVFIIAYRRTSKITEPVLGWLFGTARRVLSNQRRGQLRQSTALERLTATLPRHTGQVDQPERLRRAFLDATAKLSAADQETLLLSCWYDLTPAEAAAATECSPKTYAVRLHRARQRLAAHLSADNDRLDPATLLAEALHD